MKIIETLLNDVLVIESPAFQDDRGAFVKLFNILLVEYVTVTKNIFDIKIAINIENPKKITKVLISSKFKKL